MSKQGMQGSTASVRMAVLSALAALVVPAADAQESEIEPITVTAQSRSQSERDVPIAMQVVGEKQIGDLGAANLADINGYVPSLSVDASQPTQPVFYLRGIGASDFGIGTDAPVGVYVDGIYTGKTGGSLMNFNDVQRVEVLKGPQGTLFGRNSAAGAISIVTNEPEQAADANALVRFGRFDTVVTEAMVNAPLTDTTAVRLSAESKNSNGWVTNETTGQKMGGDATWGSRASFKWSPAADTKVVASWEHEALDQAARPGFSLVRVPAGTVPAIPATNAELINPLDAPLQNDAPDRESRTFDGLTVRVEMPLGAWRFSSNSAYRHFRSYNEESDDGTASTLTYLGTINAEVNSSFQQEFKLAAHDARLDWVAGASFYLVHADQASTVDTTTDSIDTLFSHNTGAPLFGLPLFGTLDQALGAPGLGLGNPWSEQMVNHSRSTAYSVYGDAIWHLAPATNLTAGLRETLDRKSVDWYVPAYSAPALDAQFAPYGGTFGQVAGSVLSALSGATVPPLTNIIFSNAAATAATPVSASHGWSNLSPRLVLDRKFGADTMAYASVSKGYQSGGFDVFSPLARFEPEHMTNFEVGVKGSVPAIHAAFEASLFRYRFTNLQNITLVSAGAVPVYDVTTSNQSAYGADLGGRVEVLHALSLFAAAEYLRQRYDQYSYADPLTGLPVSLDGQPVGTPLLTVSGGARLAWTTLGGRTELLVQGSHTSALRCNTQLIEEYSCLNTGTVQTGTAQSRVDLRLGWQTPDQHYGAALLVNNALNKQYVVTQQNGGQAAFTLGVPDATVTPPRFVGVELNASM